MTTSNTSANTNTTTTTNDQMNDNRILVGLQVIAAIEASTGKHASAQVLDQAAKRLKELTEFVKQTVETNAANAQAQARAEQQKVNTTPLNKRAVGTILHALDNLIEQGEELEPCGHFDGTSVPTLEDVEMLYASIEEFGIATPTSEKNLVDFLVKFHMERIKEAREQQQQSQQESQQKSQQPAEPELNAVPTKKGAMAAEIIETLTGRKVNKAFVDRTMEGMPGFLRKMATTKPDPNGTLEERMAYLCQTLAPINEEDIDKEVAGIHEFLNEAAASAA
jgi:biotin carboxyl carrier protein